MEFEIALAEDGCSFENVRSRTVTVQCRQPDFFIRFWWLADDGQFHLLKAKHGDRKRRN